MKRAVKKTAQPETRSNIDPVETLKAELAAGIELLRPHYPADSDDELRWRAEYWRPISYRTGRWPSDQEIADAKAKDAAAAAADAKAAASAAAGEIERTLDES